jgi:hypothetical protein
MWLTDPKRPAQSIQKSASGNGIRRIEIPPGWVLQAQRDVVVSRGSAARP